MNLFICFLKSNEKKLFTNSLNCLFRFLIKYAFENIINFSLIKYKHA